jgi:AP-3 complex subunit mu
MQSLFLLSPTGEVLIERHFRGVVTSRSVCDSFWERASISMNHHGGVSTTLSGAFSTNNLYGEQLYDSVPPVLEVPESDQGTLYIISILRNGLSYLAVCPAEVSPLLILEFLSRIHKIFTEYFGVADESAIKDNFSTVYQLLEEMVDYGWPLTTEPNALKAMIRPPPPSVLTALLQTTTNASTATVSDALPSGTVSNMPWRASGVHYTQNEIYMDIVEAVNAIVNGSDGKIIHVDVSGSIECQSHLSGIPDLLLTFKDAAIGCIDDCSFHPCVRYARYERDQVVSFVPPDGNFCLMKYRIAPQKSRNFSPPIFCHVNWSYATPASTASSNVHAPVVCGGSGSGPTRSGRIALQVGVTSLSSLILSASRKGPMEVEEVAVSIPFPKQTRSNSGFQVNMGTVIYDEASKVACWTLGKMDSSKRATLSCSFTMTISSSSSSTSSSSAGHHGSSSMSSSSSIMGIGGGIGGGPGSSMMMAPDLAAAAEDEHKKGSIAALMAPPNLSLHWKIPLASVSGLSVSGLTVTGESYRPYKGVRNITKSGMFQVRCSS